MKESKTANDSCWQFVISSAFKEIGELYSFFKYYSLHMPRDSLSVEFSHDG